MSVLEPIRLWLSRCLFIESYDAQTRAKVADDVVGPVSWANHLGSNENDVKKVAQEKES